jgi:type VI secretion system secreted protein Hcp
MGAMAKGDHIKEALLTVQKAGGKEAVEYIKMIMKDCLISSVQCSGSGSDERLMESVTINFAEFEYTYTPQKSTGEKGGVIPFKFSIEKNKEL